MNCRKMLGDSGSTTIELVFVLAIIAIVGTAVFSLSSADMRASEESRKNIHTATFLLRCDDTIRKHVLDIRVPFWFQDVVVTRDESGITIPYYQGKKDSILGISHENGELTLTAGGTLVVLHGVKYVSALTLTGKAGEYCGLDIRYTIDGTAFRTIAGFGSSAIFKRR